MPDRPMPLLLVAGKGRNRNLTPSDTPRVTSIKSLETTSFTVFQQQFADLVHFGHSVTPVQSDDSGQVAVASSVLVDRLLRSNSSQFVADASRVSIVGAGARVPRAIEAGSGLGFSGKRIGLMA